MWDVMSAEFGFFTVITKMKMYCHVLCTFRACQCIVSICRIKAETNIVPFSVFLEKRNNVEGIREPNLESLETSVEWASNCL